MKKGIKKALVMLLSVAMVFTMMVMPVYADDFTETEASKVVLGTPETDTEPAAEEAAEPEAQEEVLIEETEPASEVVQEEVAETAEVEADDQTDETVALADGTYFATGLSTAVLSMYHFDADAARVVIKGDNAWLITSIDGAAEANTLKRFDGMAYGPQSKILDETDETHRTLIEGTPTANVIETTNDEGTVVGRTFVLPVPKTIFESNADIYYMIKYKEGYSAEHDGDWYKASGDYYLTGYTLEKVSDSTVLPGEDPAPELVDEKELEIWNEQAMFKAVSASLETYSDGSRVLVFALSGTGYTALYKGTYPEAVLDKDAIVAAMEANESTDKTIVYQTNEDGKYEFRIPLEEGETYIPLISVSKRGFDNRATQPIEEKGFYARQAVLVEDETKMNLEDYKETINYTLSTDLADFKAETTVPVYITGGPVNNNYSVSPTITMLDSTYDSVVYPSVVESAIGTKTAALTDGKFAIIMENAPNKHAFSDKTALTYTFHVAETAPYAEAGTDIERTVTFDQIAKTITVEGTALTPKSNYPAGEYVVEVKSIKLSGGAEYSMFVPRYNGVDKTALVTVAEDGTATISYENNRNTYKAIYIGELESGSDPGNLGQLPTDEQVASEAYVPTKTTGTAAPFEFEYAFNVSDLGKTIPYVTVSRSNGKFNATQLAFVFGESMTAKAAYDVAQMIDALPAAADVTIRDKDAIEAARAAYDALTDEQKAQVTNLSKLVAAEEAFAALEEKDEATTAVEAAMETLIQQYIDVNESTAAAVADTRAAYDALSKQQKAYIDDAVLFKLYRAEACVAFANDGIAEGAVYDLGIDTSDNSPFIAATISPRSGAAYVYLYSVAPLYNNANKISGTVSKSSHVVVGNGTVLKGLWQVQTDEGQGREFVVQLTGPNGNSDEYTVKFPGVYGTMAEGTYEVIAIQTPSSKMRKFERSTVTSDGTAMTVEFVMPNTSYGKIYLGTAEAAEASAEGFIEPTGTEATSGSTGVGNVYKIPLESMYQPITISYYLTSKNTWTEETVEFVVDEQAQAVIDAVAALNLNTYFNVTADQREQVNAANELYQALSEEQKAIVENSNYTTLKRVVAMFKIADIVASEIEKLPEADSVTPDDVAAIREVKADFDGMGQSDIIKEALGKKADGTWNTLQNSQIEKLISQALRDKLKATVDAAMADYTAVDAALAKVPGDLSIYTEETAAAVTAAVNAVDRTKMMDEQAAVDAMAQAIEDAVAGLFQVVTLEDGIYALPDLAAGPSAMFNHFVDDSKLLVVKGDKATIKFITDGSTGSIQKYSKIALGKSSELVTEDYQESLPEGTTIIEGQLQPYEEGSTVDKYLFEIEMTKAEAELLLGNNVPDDIYIVVWNKVGSSADKIPGWYKASNDIYLSLGKLGALMPADYTAVDTALTAVPADLSIYTEETAAAVTAAVNAVDRTKMSSEQAAVDAMAKAIDDAVAALELKPADYSKVEAAKAKVPEDLSIYTEETAAAVTAALNAVVEGKKIDEQAAVDAMAQAIEDAVAGLFQVVTLEDGIYALPDLAAGPSAMFNHFVADSKMLVVKGDKATLKFITDGSTGSIQKYSKIALGKSSELVTEDYQESLPEGTTIIEGQLQPYEEGSTVDKYLFEIEMTKAEAELLLGNNVPDDIYIVVWNKVGSSADKIPGWYKASNDIYLSLGKLGALMPADYTAVDAALAKVPSDLSIYTESTAAAVTTAVNAVDRTKMSSEQAAVDAMAKAIEDAVAALEKKPADYSKVEAAKAAVPADLSIYTDATKKAVEDAVAAVVEGKKIDEQAAVDAMAAAINTAVAALEKKPADYSKVDEAKAKVPTDLSIYTDATKKAIEDALAGVEEGKKIDEQAAVDAMAKAINDAVAGLEKKPADYSKVEEAKAKVPEDLSVYTAETREAIEKALAAVEEGKKIDEQAEVDAMAKAIEDAVAGLKLDPAHDPGLVTRIYGNTRYQTAILQAEELKEILGVEKFDNIIVATGTNYADALAGAYLGYVKDAPILLVRNDVIGLVKDYINSNIKEGGTIYLLGGEAVVPGSVASGINGANVQRLFGKDRYETNIAILEEAGVQTDSVMICTGTDFADSLSASAAKLPILLVKGGLNDTQRKYLKTLGQKNYFLVGGTGVLPAALENEVKSNYGSVTRLGGKDRYETSVKVAEALFSDPETAVVAYAQNYPDGLCGGPLAASMNAPLLLVNDKHLDAAVGYTGKAGIKGGRILGGSALISDQSARKLFSMKDEDQIIVKK